MKLRQEHQEFRNPKVFYPDPKAVELDRVLVNLFVLLRCNGKRAGTSNRLPREAQRVHVQLQRLLKLPGAEGLREHPEIVQKWLENDVFDVVHRGEGADREVIASLRPLHMDAAKIRVAAHCRDYNVADHLYASLEFGGAEVLKQLRDFLDRGRNPGTKRFDGASELDLETLAVLKIAEPMGELTGAGERVAPHPPVCQGQGRVLCDDVQRLLAYKDAVPRAVLIEYLSTVMALHTALFTLRVASQLTGWIENKAAHPACVQCPVRGEHSDPFASCPYGVKLHVDMGTDFRSRTARQAQESASAEYGRMTDLIRSLFTVNQLLAYARENRAKLPGIETPADAVGILSAPPAEFDTWFSYQLAQIRQDNQGKEESLKPEEEALFELDLPAFDRFIELVTHVRHQHHRRYLTQMLDKLFQKNKEYGALAQGKSGANPRRWHLGPRLLEVLIQLAVLEWEPGPDGSKVFRTEPMRIDEFVAWMEARYGFALGDPADADTPLGFAAQRENVNHLKRQLREIGFFEDLSDAFNAQTIRPRYELERASV